MPRLYMANKNMPIVTDVPAVGSMKVVFGAEKDKEPPHIYWLQCVPCDVRWRAETAKDKCWSCGKTRKDIWKD